MWLKGDLKLPEMYFWVPSLQTFTQSRMGCKCHVFCYEWYGEKFYIMLHSTFLYLISQSSTNAVLVSQNTTPHYIHHLSPFSHSRILSFIFFYSYGKKSLPPVSTPLLTLRIPWIRLESLDKQLAWVYTDINVKNLLPSELATISPANFAYIVHCLHTWPYT